MVLYFTCQATGPPSELQFRRAVGCDSFLRIIGFQRMWSKPRLLSLLVLTGSGVASLHYCLTLRFSAAENAVQPHKKIAMASHAARFTKSLAKCASVPKRRCTGLSKAQKR